ncbi:hypothetical protein PV325_003128 [Microctonus aethiopoides]|uniref:Equilibrative nucleoside transporter n=1 Tax=Microctonus aethiopoides TaxID=144406 RepID=A0AA39F918_9HYME|nr:hypothetical protein PV325_003128 [Microctonus aethiopoides]KAK0099165.1 hypothetical protein PV326_000002 [Microctonus aethiopoides]KAK0165182.1 hypothetical protein PV328_003724 [Microctonus aethiopoides]
MAETYTKKEFGAGIEEQTLLKDSNATRIVPKPAEPVRLSPGWEGTGKPDDELNFKGMTMDDANLELNPPRDRLNLIFFIMVLHGIGALLPWNMFITAKEYFTNYKFSSNYTGSETVYREYYISSITLSSQTPNFLFNWLNVFVTMGGDLTTRIVGGLCCQVLIFVSTVVMAMIDSSGWPGIFFWITMIIVVVSNTANGIYQNSVYGMAAKLPPKYTGAVILGSNISGVFTAVISLIAQLMSPNLRTAAIYYFMTALFVLLACFDTYFALPINRFYRYNEMIFHKENEKRKSERRSSSRPPYWKIFKQCSPQLLNIFLVFFVTLALFPDVHSSIARSDPDFIVPEYIYMSVMCFLTFNIFAVLGSSIASYVQWPSKKWLIIPVALRLLYIPLFLLCKYIPSSVERTLPVYITNDWVYFIIAVTMAVSSGYFSSLSMMYCPTMVDPQYASTAGMFGAAFLITGICSGLCAALIMPTIVSLSIWQ